MRCIENPAPGIPSGDECHLYELVGSYPPFRVATVGHDRLGAYPDFGPRHDGTYYATLSNEEGEGPASEQVTIPEPSLTAGLLAGIIVLAWLRWRAR